MLLAIFLHVCSLLALSPEDLLPAVYLCTNKIAADHENIVNALSFFFKKFIICLGRHHIDDLLTLED